MLNIVRETIRHGGSLHLLEGGVYPSMGVGNSSIERLGDDMYVSYRVCGYTFVSMRRKSYYTKKTFWFPNYTEFDCMKYSSENVIGKLDMETFELKSQKAVFKDKMPGKFTYTGYEDIRLINWDGCLYASCSKPNAIEGEDSIPISVNRLNSDFESEEEILCKVMNVEKNWMPVEGRPMEFIYSTGSPLVVLKVKKDGIDVVHRDDNIGFNPFYKGSTQARFYKDHYIVMTHYNEMENVNDMPLYQYRHVFLVYDKDWNFVCKSEPFVFFGYSIEFSCGFIIEGDNVHITFSVYDNVSFVLTVPLPYFENVVGLGNNKEFPEPDFSGMNSLGYCQKDIQFMDLCERLAGSGNYNGAFAIYTKLGAFSEDNRLAKEAYLNALYIVKKCKVGVDSQYVMYMMMEDRILDQINLINKELI